MKLVILQISDVHFRASGNIVTSRVDAIKRAVQGTEQDFDACLIAMTGDVAFSGSIEEYTAAGAFFDEMKAALASIRSGLQVEEIFIPGNHDCSLPPSKARGRGLMVGHFIKNPPFHNQNEDDLITECLEVQNNFFDFLEARSDGKKYPAAAMLPECLRYSVDVGVQDRQVRIVCYNSAWLSQLHEQAGDLIAPVWIPQQNAGTADLVVTLFHHPYGWLEPNNARAFRKIVEQSSDLVMTGHEHLPDQYTKETIRGERSEYFEGAVLQGGEDEPSGFNVAILDLDRHEYRVTLYAWQDDHYAAQQQGEWRPFGRKRHSGSRAFELTDQFTKFLADVGANFRHPQRGTLLLPDVFVYPDLLDQAYLRDKSEKGLSRAIRGEDIHRFIRDHERILIFGGERCGRTSLAKTLYSDLLQQARVPIFAAGNSFRGQDEEGMIRILSKNIEDQYGGDMTERFWQLDRAERVLIIDDVHLCRLNRKGLNALLENACRSFGTVLLFANDLFQIEEFTTLSDEQATLLAFRNVNIPQFGHRLRRRLIEKWYTLGQEYTVDEEEIAERTRNAENLVNTLLGKNLLPSYPLFVLTLLQSYEASAHHNTALGAYGYHYEALITASLAGAVHEAGSRIMVGTIYTFVSSVAFYLFEQRRQQKQPALSPAEIEQLIRQYQSHYNMRFNDEELLSILEKADILQREPDGSYAFQYSFIYFYFAARYINENLRTAAHGESLRASVKEMTQKLYVEEYANIVIFLVYLTKDEGIISGILSHAKSLYAEYEPCDLDTHLDFVKHLTGKPLPLALDDRSLQEHNEEVLGRMDEANALIATQEEEEAREKESQQIEDVLQLNAAVKTLEVMGQILRNFPGSLPGDLKLEIARESYMLGLRTIQAIYAMLEHNLDDVRLFFSEVLKHVRHLEDPKELAKQTDSFLYAMIFLTSYGMIKRVSYAVGSEQLEETYKLISDSRTPTSVALIDLSIKLDHFRRFPMGEVKEIKKLAEKNGFATSLLRRMVRDHLYLYPVNLRVRQQVCAELDIAANDPQMMLDGDKYIVKRV